MNKPPTICFDYHRLIQARPELKEMADKVTEDLKRIANEMSIEFKPFDPRDYERSFDEFRRFEYCRKDIEGQLDFINRLHHLRRVQRRRKLRHVPRGQRNMEPQRRKAYLGKRGLPTEKTVQLLERDFVTYRFSKERSGPESMALFEPISKGRPLGKISLFHGG